MTYEEFSRRLQETEQGKEYLSKIKTFLAENRGLSREEGYNLHHIHPRGLGGDRLDSKNQVKVTCFEHCVLHILLAQALPSYRTLKPLVKLSANQIKSLSDLEKATLEDIYKWSEGLNKALKVGVKKSEECKKRISENRKGMIFTEEHRKHISEAKKGYKYSEERKEIQRKHSSGRIHVHDPRTGEQKYPKKEELQSYLDKGFVKGTGLTGSEKHRDVWITYLKTRQNPNKGTVAVYKEGTIRRVPKESLEKYLEEGWVKGTGISPSEETRALMSARKVGKTSNRKDKSIPLAGTT